MPRPDWKSRRILGDIEHFDVFEKLFKAAELGLLLAGGRTPWGNKARQLSLVDVYEDYVQEFRDIKSRRDMVADMAPVMMVKAVHNALCKHFREPTYGYDTGRDPPDPRTADLLRIDSRALIILNFTKTLMQAVIFHYEDENVLDEKPDFTMQELTDAVRQFETDPEGAMLFIENKAIRKILKLDQD